MYNQFSVITFLAAAKYVTPAREPWSQSKDLGRTHDKVREVHCHGKMLGLQRPFQSEDLLKHAADAVDKPVHHGINTRPHKDPLTS